MKKIALILSSAILALSSCNVDNYDGPNSSIHGKFVDEKTGELVGTDIRECDLKVVEHGYTNPSTQSWHIQNTGEYRNNMVFSGTYDMRVENSNMFAFEEKDVVVKPGDNTKDFKVTPYLRVLNPTIKREGNKIVALFGLEGGRADVKVASVQLFAFSDMWVGNSIKFGIGPASDGSQTDVINFETPAVPATSYRLEIDLSSESGKNNFRYTGKNYYFRIGAKAAVDGAGTIRHNYSPLVVIEF